MPWPFTVIKSLLKPKFMRTQCLLTTHRECVVSTSKQSKTHTKEE
jgi:hypothetical protein